MLAAAKLAERFDEEAIHNSPYQLMSRNSVSCRAWSRLIAWQLLDQNEQLSEVIERLVSLPLYEAIAIVAQCCVVGYRRANSNRVLEKKRHFTLIVIAPFVGRIRCRG